MNGSANVALGELMAQKLGSVDPLKFVDEEFDLYSIPAFDRGTPDALAGHAIGSTKQIVQPGDVLLSRIVPHIRRAWVVGPAKGRRIIASGEWIVFRSARADPRYLRHALVSDSFHTAFMNTVSGVGGSLLRARPAYVAQIAIPLPSLASQRRIADTLDKADALRSMRRDSLGRLDEIYDVVFRDMFAGEESRAWTVVKIADVVGPQSGAIRTGPFGSQLLHGEFTDSGVAVLGIDNAVSNHFRWGQRRFISESKYKSLRRYTVNAGDVLITIMRTCGRCAVVPDDVPVAINTKHLCCISLDRDKCLPVFLHAYFLRHPLARGYLAQKAKGAIMNGLNMEIIRGMPVPLPPIDLQHRFVKAVTRVDQQASMLRNSSTEMDALFASLQQRAFRGELTA